MADKILIKRSDVEGKAPTVNDLVYGELALNTYDAKLYSIKNDGVEEIFEIGPVKSVNGQDGEVILDTDDVEEGTNNLYFTDSRAQDSISVSGDLEYANGVISFSETYSNASELITAIKTVDGSDSGLDADTLDGQEASEFVQQEDQNLVFEYSGDGGLIVRTLDNSGSYIFQARSSDQVSRLTVVHGAPELLGDASGWKIDGKEIYYEGNFDPSTKLDTTAKASDSDLLDGLESDSFASNYVITPTTSSANSVGYTGTATGGFYSHLRGGSDQSGKTFSQAMARASILGVRLPTIEELEANIAKGTGGGLNNSVCWTCTAVPGQPGYVYAAIGADATQRLVYATDDTDTADCRFVANVEPLKVSATNASINTEVEEVTLSSGQTTVNLSSITLQTNRPQLYVEGSFEQDFTVTNNTTIELGQSFPSGTRVFILQSVLVV